MPIVFVHGITIRKERFDSLLATVRAGFLAIRPRSVVEGFYWGDMASSLKYGGASIPGFATGTRALEEPGETLTDTRQLKALLLDDPLLELKLIKDQDDLDSGGGSFAPMPLEAQQRNQALQQVAPRVVEALVADPELPKGIGKLVPRHSLDTLVNDIFNAAAKADRLLTIVDLIDPLARGLCAYLYKETETGQPVRSSEFKWLEVEMRVQKILEDKLGGQRSLVGDKLRELAGGVAAHGVTFAMRHGLRRRIMGSIAIFVGDVLAYMAKRENIQAELGKVIGQAIAQSNTPLWLVGHSLGGILCFDYCVTTSRTIQRLITVGSQVGLFGELGAFPNVSYGANGRMKTPDCIQEWINVYDTDDILSFLAEPVMTRVTDIQYDTQSPFPLSHSEYWNQPTVYDKLTQ